MGISTYTGTNKQTQNSVNTAYSINKNQSRAGVQVSLFVFFHLFTFFPIASKINKGEAEEIILDVFFFFLNLNINLNRVSSS